MEGKETFETTLGDLIVALTEETAPFVSGVRPDFLILLKNPMNASTRLSMNGKSPMISTAPPFVLRFSKDERKVFQQNLFRRRKSSQSPAGFPLELVLSLAEGRE